MMKLRSKVASARSSRLPSPFLVIELRDMELERQVVVGDPLAVAGRDDALDQVLELADVARPPVVAEHAQGRFGDAFDVLVEPRVVARRKNSAELRQVVEPLAQRRQPHRDHVEAVEEVARGTCRP